MSGRSRYDSASSPFISKLYWPTVPGGGGGIAHDDGLLIGWNDVNFVANVVAIVPGSDLDSLEQALLKMSSNASLSKLWEHCSGSPIVIGNYTRSASTSSLSQQLDERRRTADFWIQVEIGTDQRPILSSVFCCGFLYRTSTQILLYDPPQDRCSYLSDAPFTFDWTEVFTGRAQDLDLVTDLQLVLRQISSAGDVQEELISALEQVAVESPRHNPSSSDGLRHRLQQRFQPMQSSLDSVPRPRAGVMFRGFVTFTHLTLVLWRIGCHLALVMANFPLPMIMGGRRIKDRSAVFRQIDRRIVDLTQWPEMWVRMRSPEWHPKAYVNASMIAFLSSICQFLVDILSGIVVGCLLRAHSQSVLETIHNAGQILHVDVLRRQVIWLMGLPAGMKLNFALDQSLGSMVLYGIDFWNAITTVLTPLESHIITAISLIAGFGLSVAVACAIDLLSMMTTHVLFVHTAFSRLYALSLSALSALSKLFSGKKHNILQRRIDSCHFDVDQLLLGTILFTLIFFLFPTIAIYYLFFAIVRFLIMLVEAGLHLSMATLNNSPYFELAIFLFDRRRLPSGIRLEVLQSVNPSSVYLRVHSCCVELGTVFRQCRCNIQSVLNRYSLTESLRCLLYGLPIPPSQSDLSDEDIIMDFSPGITGFWFFLKTHLDAQ